MAMRYSRCATVLALVAAGACTPASRIAVTVGPGFSADGGSAMVSVEASGFMFTKPGWTRAGTGYARLQRSVGVAATATAGGMWHSEDGFSGAGSAGIDFIPILHSDARDGGLAPRLLVGFGGHVGYGIGESGRAGIAALPRLWFAASVWRQARTRLLVGGMFRCQLAFTTDELPSVCGPAFVISRVRMAGRVSPHPER